MEIRQYINIVFKWWWLMVLLAVTAAITSYTVSQRQTPVYEAAATLIVGQSIQSVNLTTTDITLSESLAQTYADMARRQPVLQAVVEKLNLESNWQGLKKRLQVRLVSGTQLLEITVQAGSAEEARIIADEIAHQLILLSPTTSYNQQQRENRQRIHQRIEDFDKKIKAGQERMKILDAALAGSLSAKQVQELQAEIGSLEQLITNWENNYTQLLIFVESEKSPNYLAIIEPAQANPLPISPRVRQNTILGGMVGFLLAIGFVFLIEFLDDTLKLAEDVHQALGTTSLLGMIGHIRGRRYHDKLISVKDPFSAMAEAYRSIRSNIQFASVDRPIKSIVITSANSDEGKSVTAANLALVMAQAGLKTIIVDADLRRPIQHEIFQVPNLGGLTEWLCSPELELKRHLKNTGIENLQALTSGMLPPNPAELLSSHRMGQLIADLAELADIIIYDSPPTLAVTDAAVLSNRVDGAVLVIQAKQTRRGAAKQAVANLQRAGANLLGVVLNKAAKKGGNYYSYQSYYSPHKTNQAGQSVQPQPKRRRQWLPFFRMKSS